MGDFSPLSQWIKGRSTLPIFSTIDKIEPLFEYGSFLSLDKHYYLHEIDRASAQSLSISWFNTKNYIEEAMEIVDGDFDTSLDKEESEWIQQELGKPPRHCYPIYIVTVGRGELERVVYIGKTSSRKNRFSGGHKVAIKLHDPKYEGLDKNIYFCCVVFLTPDKEYLPLEWIQPKEKALELLDSVESQLIYLFSPELNIQKKNKNFSKYDMNFHIQNFSDHSNFLHDTHV
ncbi:hypothetical protein PN294_13625 [Romboutsia sp. 1001216sp1]|uniref:hypothetical protein n=1 Tax=unclassified Romboutsia TaxID=2626894 RepID=UPI0018A06AFA|nr:MULTISPECIES: hypothetical protein [unclassified Romboutsia]MDB8803224.1 hypothetical protein [Romboutsia sp. 1001216sp1]MDB8814583.1 hypothetical protein [Romboutsia sp. 1001216sp1]